MPQDEHFAGWYRVGGAGSGSLGDTPVPSYLLAPRFNLLKLQFPQRLRKIHTPWEPHSVVVRIGGIQFNPESGVWHLLWLLQSHPLWRISDWFTFHPRRSSPFCTRNNFSWAVFKSTSYSASGFLKKKKRRKKKPLSLFTFLLLNLLSHGRELTANCMPVINVVLFPCHLHSEIKIEFKSKTKQHAEKMGGFVLLRLFIKSVSYQGLSDVWTMDY